MAVSSDFLDHLLDQFAVFGPIDARRMFGGFGLYRSGLMFALVTDDTLYFKTDNENRGSFEAAGMAPFSFAARGRRMVTSYFEAPAEVFDDPEALARWARSAHDAALRLDRAKTGKGSGKAASKDKAGPKGAARRGRGASGARRAKTTARRGTRPTARRPR